MSGDRSDRVDRTTTTTDEVDGRQDFVWMMVLSGLGGFESRLLGSKICIAGPSLSEQWKDLADQDWKESKHLYRGWICFNGVMMP